MTTTYLENRPPPTNIMPNRDTGIFKNFLEKILDVKEPEVVTDNYFFRILQKIENEPENKWDKIKKKKKKKKKFIHRKKWRTFTDSRSFVHSKNFKTLLEWKRYCRFEDKPKDIPCDPSKVYPKEFSNWYDFLGKTPGHINTSNRYSFRDFESARNFAQSLNLKGFKDWHKYCVPGQKPSDIPTNPYRVYKEWISWGDFLGTKNVHPTKLNFLTYKKARKFVHSLKLKNVKEWEEYCKSGKKPGNIPFCPRSAYQNKGWVKWYHWLGTKTPKSYLNK